MLNSPAVWSAAVPLREAVESRSCVADQYFSADLSSYISHRGSLELRSEAGVRSDRDVDFELELFCGAGGDGIVAGTLGDIALRCCRRSLPSLAPLPPLAPLALFA